MVSAFARKRFSRPCLRGQRFSAFAILLTSLLCGITASSAWAQTEDLIWNGEIEVSLDDGQTRESTPIQVNFDASNRFTYWIRLSAPPVYRVGEQKIPWWIRIFVDGAVRIYGDYNSIRWTPSVGWEFSEETWDTWRQVSFRIDNEATTESLSIFHEV